MLAGMRVHLSTVACAWILVACGSGSSPGSPVGIDSGEGVDTGAPASDAGGGKDATPGNDSAAPDSSPPNDASPGEAGLASCTGIRYCDGFESYGGAVNNGAALGPWKATVMGSTMVVDTVKPHDGAKSLHITVPAGAGTRATLNQTVAAGLVPGNNAFGRAMVFYSNTGGNGLPLAAHSWIFNSAGTSTVAAGNVTMNMGGGGAKMQLNYHPPAPLPEQSVQGGTMTAGVWHCVQWQYDGSGTPPKDDAKVWVDGVLAVEAPPSKAWNFATPWSSFDFGFTHYQTLANGVEIFLDDFALNETMVACPP